MSRIKSEMKSGAGSTLEVITKLVNSVQDAGGTDNHVKRILNEPEFAESLANQLVLARPASWLETVVFEVHDMPVALLCDNEACIARQDFVEIDWEEKPRAGRYEGILLKPLHAMKESSQRQVEEELKRHGVRSATIYELLTFARVARHKLEPGKPVFGFGSLASVVGDGQVPYVLPLSGTLDYKVARMKIEKVLPEDGFFLGIRPKK